MSVEFSRLGKNQLVTAIQFGYELGSIADELIHYGASHEKIYISPNFGIPYHLLTIL
jgi:hypothetical protein